MTETYKSVTVFTLLLFTRLSSALSVKRGNCKYCWSIVDLNFIELFYIEELLCDHLHRFVFMSN